MSSTTQILFNSPALHSLKREQLIKLCKIHSIKATGKNVDLIEKLKQHALTLPRDAPLSIATRSEGTPFPPNTNEVLELGDPSRPSYERSRPSEQWEVVMDSIDEIEDASSAQGSLNSLKTIKNQFAGEFGTTGGSMSTVGSSLRAFASSLGLKRTGPLEDATNSKHSLEPKLPTGTTAPETTGELAQSIIQSSQLPSAVPAPQSDPFISQTHGSNTDVDMEAPVPGQALRPGVPAPPDARLSLGLGLTEPQTPSKGSQPTTTIRLICGQHSYDVPKAASPTPQLIPFKTTFDLIMSPRLASGIGFSTLNSAVTWSSENTDLYPTLPTDAGEPSFHAKSPEMGCQSTGIVDADGDVGMPGAFTLPYTAPATDVASDTIMASPSESALRNTHLNTNTPVPFVFGSPLPGHRVSDVQFREAAANVLDEMNQRLQAEGVNPVDLDIIKRLHPRSAAVPQTASACENQTGEIRKMFEKRHQAEFDKMEGIDAVVKRKATSSDSNAPRNDIVSKKRKSSVLVDEPRRVPAPVAGRASGTRVISNGRRGKMVSEAFSNENFDQAADADEERGKKRPKMDGNSADVHATILEEQKKKEREREAVRRKLEINKAERRSSAAAARRSGRVSIGKAQQKQQPSRFGFLAQAKSFVKKVFGRSKPTTTGTSTVMAPTASSKAKAGKSQEADEIAKKTFKNAAGVSRVTTEPVAGTSRTVGNRTPLGGGIHEKGQTTTSTRSRSPLPSLQHSIEAQVKNGTSPAVERENTSMSNVSSIGRKTPMTEGKASSMGVRGLLTGGTVIGSLGAKVSERERVPSSSRLLAPTASSLAKTSGRIATTLGTTESLGDSKHVSRIPVVRKQNTLTSITNNLTPAKSPSPLTAGKIFTKPLSPAPFSSGNVAAMENEIKGATLAASSQPPLQRQRTLSGRKPRISRSKVISRLASQRANAVKHDGTPKAPRASATDKPISAGRTRSSLGTQTNKPTGRSSHSGLRIASGGNDVLMSAKKKARQSEYYARRRTRVEGTKPVKA